MQLFRYLVIISIFLSSQCLGEIFITTKNPAESSIVEAVVQTLESCYKSNTTIVGVSENFTGIISEALSSQENLSITLIDANTKLVNNGPVSPQSLYKLQVFVIASYYSVTLSRILKQMKASIWWNHMAHFLILDVTSTKDSTGCPNAFELLWTAWNMNILNANMICHNLSNVRLIYTFNPFTSYAPKPWKFVKTYSGKKINHPWNLFVRKYDNNYDEICEELYYDKTSDMGGYEIRLSVSDFSYGYQVTKSDGNCFGPYWDIFCEILLPALNGTPIITVHPSPSSLGYVDPKGNVTGVLGDVANGFSDFAPTNRLLTLMPNLTTSYPIWQSDMHCATKYRGYKSQLSKIGSVIDRTSHYCLFGVCLVTVLFFKYFITESLSIALLNTFRMICNSCIPIVPDNMASRIYLGCLFIFLVTMQGIYQGKLAALLTHDEPLPNVDSMSDLINSNIMVYGFKPYGMYFDDLKAKGRFVPINDLYCSRYAIDNPEAACVATSFVLLYEAVKYRLHMSRDVLASGHEGLPIRPDWPLEGRVNNILLRSIDTYQVQYLRENLTHEYNRLLELQRNSYKDPNPKVLTLEQLSFAFVILFIGLVCATISFIIEVSIA